MLKQRAKAFYIVVIAAAIGYFVYASQQPGSAFPFHLGLDLSGGTHLVYQADVSKLAAADIPDSMSALRDDVERRVNLFGVSEPIVQTEQGAALSSKESAYKLIVELPGVTNVDQAVSAIGATPALDFRLASGTALAAFKSSPAATGTTTPLAANPAYLDLFKSTGLTGAMVGKASVQYNSTTNAPQVGLTFTSEGRTLFDSMTKGHIGDYIGIFLDGTLIEAPVVQEEIPNGQAQITGGFTLAQAQTLVRNINFGALPIPITLISSETIGPTLGQEAVSGGIKAAIIAFIIIAAFLILWYRLPGLIASLALVIYVMISLAIFKLGVSPLVIILCIILMILAMRYHWGFGLAGIALYVLMAMTPGALSPVTLTSAGIAGFILSIGMAVDANILIFERMKEELPRLDVHPRLQHVELHHRLHPVLFRLDLDGHRLCAGLRGRRDGQHVHGHNGLAHVPLRRRAEEARKALIVPD
jgi:protein-export membrane protein SecD